MKNDLKWLYTWEVNSGFKNTNERKKIMSKSSRKLILLACLLGILAAASDSGIEAQTHPVCASLGATTALLGGTVEYCGASGLLGADLQLEARSSFLALSQAQLFEVASVSLLGQLAQVDTQLVNDRFVTRVALNE